MRASAQTACGSSTSSLVQTRTVKTYLELGPASGEERQTLKIWEANWRKRGWSTRVLTPGNAAQHPRFREFLKLCVNAQPAENPKKYGAERWIRWLALAQDGGGLLVDFDVLNRAYPQANMPNGTDLVILGRAARPCAVLATKIGSDGLVNDILAHKPPYTDYFSYSYFFMRGGKYPTSELCIEAGDADWQEAPLVHYSGNACRLAGRDRHDWMRELA